MRRVFHNSSRVLSAILSVAMIFTSLPVSGMTAYAEESAYGVAVTENAAESTAEATEETTEDTAAASSEGTMGDPVADTDEASAEGSAEGSADGTAEDAGAASTEGTTESSGEASTEGATEAAGEAATEGAAEGTTEGTTETVAEGATEGTTEAAAEGLTEAAAAGDTEETAEEETDEASAFDVFPGMGEDYALSVQELADKEALAESLVEVLPDDTIEEDYEDAEGVYALGEVVYLADSEEEAQRVADAYGGTLKSYSYGVAVIALGQEATVSLALCAAADEDTLLPAVWPNYYYELMDTVDTYYDDPALSDQSQNYQWQHDYIGTSYAWAAGYEGQGIKVAVIDSGVDTSHEDLANATAGRNFGDGAEGTEWNVDEEGHGTHVAGIIAATADNGKGGAGIAPKASVTGYRILVTMGDDMRARESDLLRAIEAAISDGEHIINMSLGGFYYSQNMATTISKAYNNGVAVFCAAGNESCAANSYPAAYPGAISVAAVDQSGARASFSNYGSTVDLAFPGVGIYSTVPALSEYYYESYTQMSGTSMATPAAAGTAAVILSAREDILNQSGKARVDALLTAMKKGAIKSSSSGMGAGTTYLPNALGLATVETVPSTPTIEIEGTLDAKGRNYMDESVTATIRVTSRDTLAIYYSTDGKTPTYRNGVVTNGTLLTDQAENRSLYTGTVELTGARKVTLKAIALNTTTGKVSKVATKAVSLTPIPSEVEITQANGITSVTAGKKVTLKATVTPGYAISTKVQWSVDEAAAAAGIKVSNGTVSTTSKTPNGEYTITATAVGADGKTYDGVASEPYTLRVINSVKVTAFKFNPNKVTLCLPGETTADLSQSLVITLDDPEQTAPGVLWSSSNTKVAAVDANGVVTALGKGKATITAMLNDGSGKKATCAVTVNSMVTGIALSGPTQVAVGKSITLTAGITPADANNKKVLWSVEGGNGLVTVSNGRVTARKGASGTVTVTATAADGAGATAAWTVSVLESAITKITLSGKSMTLFRTIGVHTAATTGTLEATVAGGDASAITFTSSAPNIVAVTQEGTTATLTARAAGKATITCAATDGSGRKATCTVNVNIPMSRLVITPANGATGYVAQGRSVQLVTKYGARFGTPTNKKVVWSSDNEWVTVTQSGKVTVNKNAPLKITAEDGTKITNTAFITAEAADGSGVFATYEITVRQALKKVYLQYAGDGDLIVCAEDANGTVYHPTSYDTQISGDSNAACNVQACYITPIPGKVTYPYASALPDDEAKIPIRYTQKMTVTVTLKDGSNLKGRLTVWVARNEKGETHIYKEQ